MIAALSAVVMLVGLWVVPSIIVGWPAYVTGGFGALIALMAVGAYADR